MLTVVLWVLAFLAHLLERDADRTSSRAARIWTIGLLLVGGYGLTGTWFVAGVLGIPRRYAVQPVGTSGYSLVGSIFAVIFALGFLSCVVQLALLARTARRRRRHSLVDPIDTPTEALQEVRAPHSDGDAPDLRRPQTAYRDVPFATAAQLGFALAACVVALAAFFPQVVDASEVGVRYHHLDHAGQFFFGLMLGLLLGSQPAISRLLGERPTLGLALVVAAPMAMMLLMVPRFYEPLEGNPFEHALYHLAMAAFGLATGVGATRLGLIAGRFAAFLAVAMALMFAAAMTGG
jgi:hypothetical protein